MIATTSEPVDSATIKVLIIENDNHAGQALVDGLKESNMNIAWAMSGAAGIALQKVFSPDVLLLDLNLPDRTGIDVVNYVAQQAKCGLIIVSDLADVAERIIALELGADDYVPKPPPLRELAARIRAVSRRVKLRAPAPAERNKPPLTQAGTLTIDPTRHAVHSANGGRIAVTSAEFLAIKALIDARGEPVSRSRLSEAALNHPWEYEDRSIDQLVYNLRRKLLAAEDATPIISVRGAGYLIPRD